MEKRRMMDHTEDTTQVAVCACGKDLADCACAKGEVCTCGGDPRLCGAQTVESIDLVLDASSLHASGPLPSRR